MATRGEVVKPCACAAFPLNPKHGCLLGRPETDDAAPGGLPPGTTNAGVVTVDGGSEYLIVSLTPEVLDTLSAFGAEAER